MEDNASVVDERASESGRVHGGGTGRMGSRWQWLCPISTTEGGLKMATGPPHINSIQGDALSSRQRDTFLTTSKPPSFNPLIALHWRC
ncbi:hypothetical protein CesoFtcFv8_003851 [Champsocephalus esox]|uniref:Uncharacterized protein n=1 Tax=Champsocephalus esox TaxID=159716 RepID=A0AAN8HEZ5_9TELE|nr:hypothetical protein CesoFtcFv8_003851 [Champsocephalus esox]